MSALRVHPVDLTDRIAEIGLQLARRSPPPAGAILACLNSLEILGTKADGDVNQLRREVGGLLERIKREEDVSEEAYRLFDLAETRGIDPRSIDPCLYLSDFPDDVKLVLAASFADRVYDPDELVQFLPWLKEGLHYFSRPENASYGYTIVLTALERLSKSEYNNQLQDLIAPLQDQLIQMTSEPLVDLQNAILAALILNNLGEEWNSAILDRGIERTRLRQAADFMEKIGF